MCWTMVGDDPQKPDYGGSLCHAIEFGLPQSTKGSQLRGSDKGEV